MRSGNAASAALRRVRPQGNLYIYEDSDIDSDIDTIFGSDIDSDTDSGTVASMRPPNRSETRADGFAHGPR